MCTIICRVLAQLRYSVPSPVQPTTRYNYYKIIILYLPSPQVRLQNARCKIRMSWRNILLTLCSDAWLISQFWSHLNTFSQRWPPRSGTQHRTHPLISPELGLQQGVNNISRSHNLFLTTSTTAFIFIDRLFKDLYKQVSQFQVVRLCLNNACFMVLIDFLVWNWSVCYTGA